MGQVLKSIFYSITEEKLKEIYVSDSGFRFCCDNYIRKDQNMQQLLIAHVWYLVWVSLLTVL